MSKANTSVEILGSTYKIACPPEEADAVKNAAVYLNNKLLEVKESSGLDEKKAAIITALERGSLSPIEREFVIRYAKNTTLGDKAVELLVPGALSPSSIELMENLLESNEEE